MIKFAWYSDRWVMIDGQHRLHAIVRAGKPMELIVCWWTTDRTLEEVRLSYIRTDQNKIRNIADAIRATGSEGAAALNNVQMKLLVASMSHLLSNFQRILTADRAILREKMDLLKLAVSWAPEARMFFEDITGADTDMGHAIRRGIIMAVALATYADAQAKARKFWRNVASRDGLRSEAPELRLGDFLMKTPVKGSSVLEYSRRIAVYWNAYYNGRTLRIPSTIDVRDPIRLDGTRYDGTVSE